MDEIKTIKLYLKFTLLYVLSFKKQHGSQMSGFYDQLHIRFINVLSVSKCPRILL